MGRMDDERTTPFLGEHSLPYLCSEGSASFLIYEACLLIRVKCGALLIV